MNKIFITLLFTLLITACSELPKIDRFQIQDDLVTDTKTGLMWTRCLIGEKWNGTSCEGKATSYNWQKAQETAKTFQAGNHQDWRIPTLDELKTLADYETETAVSAVKIPHINQVVFPTPNCLGAKRILGHHDGRSCWQWSSSPVESNPHYIWMVYFDYGYGSANSEMDSFALRLVRSGSN